MAILDELQHFLSEWHNDSPTLEVQTSGSTGAPKRMLADKARMLASARRTCDVLGLHEGDTILLCMPLRYIAGKMVVVRAIERRLRLVAVDPTGHPLRDLANGRLSVLDFRQQPPLRECITDNIAIDLAAMVPLQVYNALQVPEERVLLQQIRHLIIGGGAIDDVLETELKTFPNAIWSTYGMTETLSHIALRRISGSEASRWYTPMEGVGISLSDNGTLTIDAPAVCPVPLVTNDLARINDRGEFMITGRCDNTISTGGIKVQIEEVERALRPFLGDSFMITCQKDPKFGQQVVILVSPACTLSLSEIQNLPALNAKPYWMPKRLIRVVQLPLTGTGKPDRARAKHIANLPDICYKVKDDLSLCGEDLMALIDTFPHGRREATLKYKFESGRQQSALAYDLLRQLLHERFCIDQLADFSFTEHGKPYLEDFPWVYFNISHCKEAVAAVVSEVPCGIDVEAIRSFREDLGHYVLSDEEFYSVASSPSPDRSFIHLWTQKEAFLKLSGEGINDHLGSVLSPENLIGITLHTQEHDTYIVSVASPTLASRYKSTTS